MHRIAPAMFSALDSDMSPILKSLILGWGPGTCPSARPGPRCMGRLHGGKFGEGRAAGSRSQRGGGLKQAAQ
jgi:hypothetical protein